MCVAYMFIACGLSCEYIQSTHAGLSCQILARIIFYHSKEMECEVLGSVAQPEPMELSRSKSLPH